MSLLKVEDLRVSYRRIGMLRAAVSREPASFDAVAGVSFEIEAGKTMGLVGESGSGKSTIARTLIGLKRPAAGSQDATRGGASSSSSSSGVSTPKKSKREPVVPRYAVPQSSIKDVPQRQR